MEEKYEHAPLDFEADVEDLTCEVAKGSKAGGILIGILMIILGIVFLIRPIDSEVVLMYFATAGFVIYGVFQIIVYARTPAAIRNGWNLANGIGLPPIFVPSTELVEEAS